MSKKHSGFCGVRDEIWQYVVLFAACYINFNVDGYNFAFGLLKLEIEKEYPKVGKQWIALIGSLVPGLYCLLSPLATEIEKKITMRPTIITAAGLQLTGFAIAFFNKWGYAVDLLALGVFQGVGSALLLTTSISSITDRFDKEGKKGKKALAAGLVTAGSPFGAIFYGTLFKTFLEATPFGWRGTMLFFAGLSAFNILCGIVYTPPDPPENQSDKRDDPSKNQSDKRDDPSKNQSVKSEDPELCNYKFFGLLIMTSLFIMGYYVPPLLIPGQARNPNYDVSKGVQNNIILIWGVANCIGRILVGFLGDISLNANHKRPYLSSYTIITFCTTVCAAAMFIFPHVMIYGDASFVSLQIVYGFFVAGGISLRSVILKELLGGSVAKPMGWMFFSDGVFVVIGFCLSAYVDTISPIWAYSFAGVCFAAAVVFMFTLWSLYSKAYGIIRRKNNTNKKAEKEAKNMVEARELLTIQNDDANPV